MKKKNPLALSKREFQKRYIQPIVKDVIRRAKAGEWRDAERQS